MLQVKVVGAVLWRDWGVRIRTDSGWLPCNYLEPFACSELGSPACGSLAAMACPGRKHATTRSVTGWPTPPHGRQVAADADDLVHEGGR